MFHMSNLWGFEKSVCLNEIESVICAGCCFRGCPVSQTMCHLNYFLARHWSTFSAQLVMTFWSSWRGYSPLTPAHALQLHRYQYPGCSLINLMPKANLHLERVNEWMLSFQALKIRYFSNRPGPTPGPQLPRPNSSTEVLKEKENLMIGIKRKRDSIEQGEENMHTHLINASISVFVSLMEISMLFILDSEMLICSKSIPVLLN